MRTLGECRSAKGLEREGREADVYARCRRGLDTLRRRLPQTSLHLHELLILEQRLTENLDRSRLYGDTDERRAGRSAIIARLNHLCRVALGLSFNDLCLSPV